MKTCHIIFQTHWDREWYYPFETFRYRLTHVIKRVLDALDHHEIDKFILDGQTLPLEDFLEVAEETEKEKILAYIKEGKVVIGPWYIAMDESLVTGESIVRNLEIGIKTAESYGKNQYLGYLPDTFGHIGQMPQI
jgi:alpha-mannosidase